MEIKGSVAVVTGGASGLGEATVRFLVENGASVSIFRLFQIDFRPILSGRFEA